MILPLTAIISLNSSCGRKQLTPFGAGALKPEPRHPHGPAVWAKGSIVNTTYNTYRDGGGKWVSTMGPLTPNRDGGIVCDHVNRKFRDGDYALWFVAPSDVPQLGNAPCSPNQWGGEPTCRENYHRCGEALRISCEGSEWCAAASGSPSIYADFAAGKPPVNNYLPQVYVEKLREKYGSNPPRVKSIILYVTDFCPRLHSANRSSGNCQEAQVDISTAAFMLLAKRNQQGYINSGLTYKVERLARLPRVLGPETGDGPSESEEAATVDAIPGLDAATAW